MHALLHSSGLASKWQQAGLTWVCFFQVRGGGGGGRGGQIASCRLERCPSLIHCRPGGHPPPPPPSQDTNALVFRALIAALGVSARHGYDMNSIAVPRRAKEV